MIRRPPRSTLTATLFPSPPLFRSLFRPGTDFLVARDGAEMAGHLRMLKEEPAVRAALVASGLETIRARHSCAHRADELLGIVQSLAPSAEFRSEEHTSELQSLMRISYAVICLKQKKQ